MKKLVILLIITAFVCDFSGCSKSSSASAPAGPVTAVATPGAVSVVTAN